jgi:serine/threonine protein kinase
VSVTQRLGSDLESLFTFCGEKFSLKTVLLLADRMMQAVQYIHKKGWIYRDFRPENFLVGQGNRKHALFVINFQLAKRHSDRATGVHIPYCEDRGMVGTARYASMNAHRGAETSRRDDMESIGYVLLHFLRGRLPWQGLRAKTSAERNARILSRKQATVPALLCANFPGFQPYFDHVLALEFAEEPDYNLLRALFRKMYVTSGYAQLEDNDKFDWDILRGSADDPRIVDW